MINESDNVTSEQQKEGTDTEEVRQKILAVIRKNWIYPVLNESDFKVNAPISQEWRTIVYQGTLLQSDRHERLVVVKEFNRQTASRVINSPARRERLYEYFRRECGVWRKIGSHPNIVEILGIMESYRGSTFPVVVIPYCSHRDLRRLVSNKPGTPVRTRAKLMYDVAKGLGHLHSFSPPVVHRDIKGSNILVKTEGEILTACIADFGSAKFSFANEYNIASSTKSGVLDWLAPECLVEIKNKTIYSTPIPASDVWSFACTFLEALTARDPWGNDGCTIEALESGDRPDRPNDVQVENVYWSVMLKCWYYRPQDRPTSEDISTFLRTLGLGGRTQRTK